MSATDTLPARETLVRRILRTYDRATPGDHQAGAAWYAKARDLAAELAAEHGHTVEQAAAAIAHLSVRQTWKGNRRAARDLLRDPATRPAGIMTREYGKALDALQSDDPLSTFTGPKTRRFYLNILGDPTVVTVDVWAARTAGITEQALKRRGVYGEIEHAFRLAARRRQVTPSTLQAVAWVVERGRP